MSSSVSPLGSWRHALTAGPGLGQPISADSDHLSYAHHRSYADIAAKNRLPESQQPHPDPALLEGDHHDPADRDLSHSTATDEKIHGELRCGDSLGAHNSQLMYVILRAVVTQDEFQQVESALESPPAPSEPPRLSADDAPATLPGASSSTTTSSPSPAARQAEADTKKAAEDTKKAAKETKEEVKDKASKAYSEGEKKLEKGKEEASKEYAELSEKAKKAYDRLSEEAKNDWHKLSKESKKRWEEAKNSDAGQELQKPEVWGSLLGLGELGLRLACSPSTRHSLGILLCVMTHSQPRRRRINSLLRLQEPQQAKMGPTSRLSYRDRSRYLVRCSRVRRISCY